MPEYLISEPVNLYSTLIMAIGILIPFLFTVRYKKKSEIQEVSIENLDKDSPL